MHYKHPWIIIYNISHKTEYNTSKIKQSGNIVIFLLLVVELFLLHFFILCLKFCVFIFMVIKYCGKCSRIRILQGLIVHGMTQDIVILWCLPAQINVHKFMAEKHHKTEKLSVFFSIISYNPENPVQNHRNKDWIFKFKNLRKFYRHFHSPCDFI